MAETEYKFPYTAEEIKEKLDEVDDKASQTEVNEVKKQLKDISASETTGISAELTTMLRRYFTNVQTLLHQIAYVTENNVGKMVVQNAMDIVTVLGGGEAPDEPIIPEVTLSSISATYNGGEVTVGTALTDLTGITVTATYSDGSTANVTGYTLSGTIEEGSNTITVSYGGKTTTFTVTAVAESGGEPVEMTKYGQYNWVNGNEYSDNGTTAYSGTVGSSSGSLWCSKVFDEDTEVSVSILYGITNNNLRQYCACVSSEYTLDDAASASNKPDLHYLTQIGTALTTEYTATYTVRAGYRLAIINYNSGIPQSMTVTA